MSSTGSMMTFGGHLEVLRKMTIRVAMVTLIFACIIFAFKDYTFTLLLAPSNWDFSTYRWIEGICKIFNPEFKFDEFHVDLIATDLSSQFMTHISTSVYLGFLCASPFILFELFKFISPALLESERKYSTQLVIVVYLLFVLGVLMSYYILFPISFRFLGTYSVANQVKSTITLDSYISTFVTLTLLMGLVFQLPVIAFVLAKMRFVNSSFLVKYRRYAFLTICLIAAIITPPDIMTLILVAVPLYMLYELSIHIIRCVENN
ncbi:MAG: twin-arginine translocase subunit TatC [Muribaculaceae bacterium]|nr:twin-arginine translocase subunit TatC [Muribaculaceae bacterium]